MKTHTPCRFTYAFALILFAGCGHTPDAVPVSRSQNHRLPAVVTTSYPLFAITQTLAGDDFSVEFPMANSDTPRQWKPTVNDIQNLQHADLLLRSSSGYEPWLAFLSLPQSRSVDTSETYQKELLRADGSVTHQHGPRGPGDNSGLAWATWLNPVLLRQQVICVSQQLQKLRPDRAESITARQAAITRELDTMNDELQTLVSPWGKTFVVLTDGPFYGYLAKRFDWQVRHIDFSPKLNFETQADSFRKSLHNLKPNLLLLRKNAPAQVQSLFRNVGLPIASVDLCESEQPEMTLMQRLNANIANLKAAINKD